MPATILYLATTVTVLVACRRLVQPVRAATAIALVLLPFCFTGRALVTGRVYAPIDVPYASEPLRDYAADHGIGKIHNGTLSDLYTQTISWQHSVPVPLAMSASTDFAGMAWILAPAEPPREVANGPGALTVRRHGTGFEVDAAMENDGWVVISESAWPGWRASVDGVRVPIHDANHAFLGVHVPQGTHRLRIVYRPESFTAGLAISLATAAALLATLAVRSGVRRARRRS